MSHFHASLTVIAVSILILSGCGGGASAQTAAPAASQAASSPSGSAIPIVPTPRLVGIEQFGVDINKNGIPDRLDDYVAQSVGGVDTKAAASAYFALLSKLSTKVMAGETLSEKERQQVFRSLDCYDNSARAEGVKQVDLDAEFMKDKRAFRGMHELMGALNGTASFLSVDKEVSCSAAS